MGAYNIACRDMKRHNTFYIQEPLFDELKRYICYVCHQWIKKDGLYVGNGIWRHAKCKPIDGKLAKKKTVEKTH